MDTDEIIEGIPVKRIGKKRTRYAKLSRSG